MVTRNQIVEKAITLLEENKWVRGETCYTTYGTRFCIMGAVEAAVRFYKAEAFEDHYQIIREALKDILKTTPIEWNDIICESKEEAIGALRKLITP